MSPTIFNRGSALGARQQQIVGRGRPSVQVEVAADGSFASGRLRPGEWNVTWWPAAGPPAAPRAVEVPEGPAPHVRVMVAGGTVDGVFLEAAGRGVQVLSADGTGAARFVLAAPYPEPARVAAFHEGRWAFGPWTPWDRLRGGAELAVPETGELLVECEEPMPSLVLAAPGGWDLARLLSLLGSRPSAARDRPLLLSGLPAGLYRVGGERQVSIRAGDRERVELD